MRETSAFFSGASFLHINYPQVDKICGSFQFPPNEGEMVDLPDLLWEHLRGREREGEGDSEAELEMLLA